MGLGELSSFRPYKTSLSPRLEVLIEYDSLHRVWGGPTFVPGLRYVADEYPSGSSAGVSGQLLSHHTMDRTRSIRCDALGTVSETIFNKRSHLLGTQTISLAHASEVASTSILDSLICRSGRSSLN
jgi:hypothetical protein